MKEIESPSLEAVAARMDTFKQLQGSFNRLGWGFHPLHGEACMAVHRITQASKICHTFQEAHGLLDRIKRGVAS